MTLDEKYMRRALQLARQGWGHTSPNPMVGAVIVYQDKIIGEGFHRCCGKEHAEVNAVANVRDESMLPQSTIYVTLEPCSHYGKTPPCAKLLIEKGIKRVVVGCLDPYVKVGGRGVEMLRDVGLDVTIGVLEEECKALNKRFFTAHIAGRPWVLLKWAQSRDGFMASYDGAVQFSTPLTQSLMHRERAMVDAILVGARTVAIDNPSLTTRHWSGNSPLRVVIDGDLSIPSNSQILGDGGKTLVYNTVKDETISNVEWKCVDVLPQAWLHDLYLRGISSVMVEGGASILRQFINTECWDEMRIEIAPVTLGSGVKAPIFSAKDIRCSVVDGNDILRATRSV